jgi:hypothetical protein
MKRSLHTVVIVVGLLVGAPRGDVRAQEPEGDPPAERPERPGRGERRQRERQDAQGRRAAERPPSEDPAAEGRVIELEELVIEGEIEKPNAFYILNRTRFGYEVLDMRTSFLPEVVDSVHGDPF